MDEVDIAEVQQRRMLEAAINYRKPVAKIAPVGRCHWCEDDFDEGSLKLFCDAKCATYYDRLNHNKR